MTSITAAIRADAATSDAEGRAQANEMVTALTIGALAETVTRLNASEDRALRLGRDLSEARTCLADIAAVMPTVTVRSNLAQSVHDFIAESSETMAALNATRLALTTAEAFRDSLQAEVDGLRVELTSMTIMRDKAHAHLAAISASLGVESVSILATIERVRDDIKRKDREWSAMRDERDALRAEVDKLRARPVVTEERLAEALHSLDLLHEPIRSIAAAKMMAFLGAVTLPAQDRAEELARAVNHGGGWPITTYAMSRALASLGAPATTPSKPADVFAGVSIEELDKVQMTAEVEYAIKVGSYSDSTPACRAAGLSAVLDALRVRLVAPVDPEEVARAYHNHDDAPAESWPIIEGDGNKTAGNAVRAMRATLTAAGIPVTPEAGK